MKFMKSDKNANNLCLINYCVQTKQNLFILYYSFLSYSKQSMKQLFNISQ